MRLLIIIVLIVLLVISVDYAVKGKIGDRLSQAVNQTSSSVIDNTLALQFRSITVPYLRSRTYSSKLGERHIYQENADYTSYLTSYSSDGLKINGLLTIPDGTSPRNGWPAIVFIHGYIPPAQYVTTERYLTYVDYLARNGFVVFKIDLRGHGDSEGKAGGGYFGSDYVVDTLNAYSALENTTLVNKKAIGLWGHSMAGNIVLRTMAVKPTIPASVIWAGAVYSYVDQVKYGIHDDSYHPPEIANRQNNNRSELFKKIGSPSAVSPFWREVAPTNYLTDLKGAIEIHHAEDDPVVTIGYSRDLVALLDKTTIPHEFYTYPTGGHNIEDPSFTLAMQRTVEFFKKYLK
ncbi:prolyl oligopeptidase family serine peptidase [soil metagenome]